MHGQQRWKSDIDVQLMLQKPEKGTGVEPQHTTAEDKQFKLTGETLYGGKGKRSGLTTNH